MVEERRKSPTVFISYAWESEAVSVWVSDLATRLHMAGIVVAFDKWDLRLGDQLPHFMEEKIRESDFVLIICTPAYRKKSESRTGGVGYEGNLITGEMFAGNERKFIGVLQSGEWETSSPSWLRRKKFVDLRGENYSEIPYRELLSTILGIHSVAPSVQLGSSLDFSPGVLARQDKYREFLQVVTDFSRRAHERAVWASGKGFEAITEMNRAEEDCKNLLDRLDELAAEFDMLSSRPVASVAVEIKAYALKMRLEAYFPEKRRDLEEGRKEMTLRLIPKFREAVRKEVSPQGVDDKRN